MTERKQKDTSKHVPKIVLGAMEFGNRFDASTSKKVTEEFLQHNYTAIDTAFMYNFGSPHSETILGSMQNKLLIPQKALISTKVHPKGAKNGLSSNGILEQFNASLQRLKTKTVDILYLHSPDINTPILDSLFTINQLYQQGKFKRFGLSNYGSWQVTEIYWLCDKYGLIKPTVYQGLYNAISRDIELELIPCLKRYNIAFYAYNILGGGLLCNKHKYEQIENDNIAQGRFQRTSYQKRYWHKSLFDGIEFIDNTLKKVYGDKYVDKQSIIDASLRWIRFHSILSKDMVGGNSNAVIIGAGSFKHFGSNLQSLENNEPLNEDVLKAFDEAWKMSKMETPSYIGNHVDVLYTKSVMDERKVGVVKAIDNALQFLCENDND